MQHAAPLARYDAVSRALHWLTVLGIAAMFVLGIWIAFFEPADEAFKLRLYNIHESTGVTLFVVTLVRLAWRIGHPAPPLPADLPPPLRIAAHATHGCLYILLLAMPVGGFLATNAWGFPLRWFGLFEIPSPIGANEALAPVFSAAHFYAAIAMAGLIGMHAGAALWHQFIRRDGTLDRML